MRFVLSQASNHDIERRLSRWVGVPVHIHDAKVAWSGYKPVIAFEEVAIGQTKAAQSPIHVNKLLMSIDLWQTLRYQKIQPKRLYLDKASIALTLAKDGEFLLTPQSLDHGKKISHEVNNFLLWFFRQREANIQDITIHILYDQVTYPIRLSSIHVLNEDNTHQAVIEAQSVNPENSKFRVVMDMVGEDFNHLSGKFYAKLSSLPLSYMDHHLELGPVKFSQGVVSSEWWATIDNSQLKQVHSDINISDLALENSETASLAKFDNFQVELNGDISRKKGVYDLLISEGLSNQLYQQRLQVAHDETGKTTLSIAQLPLPLLEQVCHFLLGKKALPITHLAGELKKLSVAYSPSDPLAVSTEFSRVSFDSPWLNAANLSGLVSGNINDGHITLVNRDGQLSFYDEALVLPFETLSGLVTWQRNSEGLTLTGRDLSFQAKDASISSQFDWQLKEGLATSSLDSETVFELSHLERYLQHVSRFNKDKRFLNWLESSVLKSGQVTGRVQTKGKLADFIKAQGQGELKAVVNVNDTTLKYHPEWPKVSNIKARLEMNNQQLNGQALTARLGQNVVKAVDFSIEPLFHDKTFLTITSKNQITTQSVMDYLEDSPIANKLDLLKEIQVSAPVNAELKLEIPLYKENHVSRLQGVVHLNGQQLTLDKPFPILLMKSQGDVYFSEEGVRNGAIQTTLYGQKLSLRLSHVDLPQSGLQIDGQGLFDFARINPYLSSGARQPLSGISPYQLSLFVHSKEQMRLSLSSRLASVKSSLPAPLAKSAKAALPLQLNAVCEHDKHQLSFNLQNKVQGELHLDEASQQLSGTIQFGAKKEKLSVSNDALQIAVRLKQLNLSQWQPYIERLGQRKGAGLSSQKKLRLNVQRLTVGTQVFHQVLVDGTEKNDRWVLNLSGREINGTLMLSRQGDKQSISGHLKKLVVSEDSSEADRVKKEKLPDMKLTIDNLVVNQARLGELKLSTHRAKDGYHIDSLDIGDKNYRIHAQGLQAKQNNHYRTTLKGYAESINLHALLTAWGINPVIDSKKASIDYQVHWNDKINAFRLNALNGTVDLSVRNGRITELNEATERQLGLGKLISILSLQTIPRRLVLDFSDLQQKGFSFDLAKGVFTVDQGKFYTKKLSIDGPVAYVEMSGLVDVAKESYDMSLKVSPHITASLPVVATIAGGPLVGAFTWLASKIVNQSMREVTSYSYYLHGPWLKPNLKQVSISHKRRT